MPQNKGLYNFRAMSRWVLLVAYLFTISVLITPPGVCPCWLMIDPRAHHPHFDGHPEVPHQHEYLLDYFQSQTIVPPPVVEIPIALLIAWQAASGLWQTLAHPEPEANGWALPPPLRPPRPLKNVA